MCACLALAVGGVAHAQQAPERSLGPFEMRSASGDVLRPGFAAQFLGTLTDPDASKRGRDADDRFWMRRLRIRLDARLLDDRLRAGLQLNLAPASLELMDVWFEGRPVRHWAVRVGQFKVPFTQYRDLSFRRLALVDWSLGPNYFGSERQLGACLRYRSSETGLAGDFGVFAGESARASYSVATMLGYGEVPLTHFTSWAVNAGIVDQQINRFVWQCCCKVTQRCFIGDVKVFVDLHGELAARVMHAAQGMPLESLRDLSRDGLRHLVALSGAWDADPHPMQDLRGRVAPELGLAWMGVTLRAVGYAGWFTPVRRAAGLGPWGGFVELNVVTHPRFDIAARYAQVELSGRLRRDQVAYGRAQVEGAANMQEAAARYGAAGTLRREREVTFGGNLFLVGHQLEIQVDASALAAERDEGSLWAIRLRTQVQIAF